MNNITLLRKYVRLLLESLPPGGGHSLMANAGMGHNTFQSPEDIQYTYEDTLDVDIDIFPLHDGKTHVQVKSLKDKKLSSPVRVFSNEEEARDFARKYTEKLKRIMMSKES